MGSKTIQDIVQRLQKLERQVDAYGHLLTAAELDRSLPGLVPILARGEVTAADAGALLKEILQRGPAALLADLEEYKRIAGVAREPQIYAALNQVHDAFLRVVRYNAAALLRRLEHEAPGGPTATLHKEVLAFTQGVARAVPVTAASEEAFGDMDLGSGDSAVGPPAGGAETAGAATPRARSETTFMVEAEGVSPPLMVEAERMRSPSMVEAEGMSPPYVVESEGMSLPVNGSGEAGADPQAVAWIHERVDVFNDMLQRWAASEPLDPDSSNLVRRGRLPAERCRELYHELLDAGALPVLDRFVELRGPNGADGEEARALRGQIVDGAVRAVPRLLGVLSAGGQLHTELDGMAGDPDRVLADLADYLSRAADLYDMGSPLRERLLYLAGEIRAVTNL